MAPTTGCDSSHKKPGPAAPGFLYLSDLNFNGYDTRGDLKIVVTYERGFQT